MLRNATVVGTGNKNVGLLASKKKAKGTKEVFVRNVTLTLEQKVLVVN